MSCILMLQGRIGKIEKKLTTNSITVAKISIASSNDDKTKDGTYLTEWTDVVAYGKKAEYICNNYHTGDVVSAIAKKQTNKVTDNNGNNKYYTNYNLCEAFYAFQLLHKKQNSNTGMNQNNIQNEQIPKETKNDNQFQELPSLNQDTNSGTGFKQDFKIEEEIPF